MPLCPNLFSKDSRDEFNGLLERLGGLALELKDVRNRSAYLKTLSDEQRAAYNEAHALWDQEKGSLENINERLELEGRLKEALSRAPPAPAPVEKVTPALREVDLDMSPQARKARAEAQGFDTSKVWYHGTQAAGFSEFDVSDARRAAGNNGFVGVSMTPGPSDVFASGGDRPGIYPLYVRVRNPFVWDMRDGGESLARAMEIYPDLPDSPEEGWHGSPEQRAGFSKALAAAGYDALDVKAGRAIEERVVFDLKNIRSVNAAFDPGREQSPKLMAAIRSTPEREPTLEETLSSLRDRLGVIGPLSPGRGKEKPNARAQVLAIANEGAAGVRKILGPELQPLLQQHADEVKQYAYPNSPDQVNEGFKYWFRDWISHPDPTEARTPNFSSEFSDLLDAKAPDVLENIDRLRTSSRERVEERIRGAGSLATVPAGAGGAPPIPPAGGAAPPPSGEGEPKRLAADTKPAPERTRLRNFLEFYASTFQPELVSDKALQAEPLFAKYKAASANEKDAIIADADERWFRWNKASEEDQLAFLRSFEAGALQGAPELSDDAFRYKQMLDRAWEDEKFYGSRAYYVENYLQHVYKDPEGVARYFEARGLTQNLGPTSFQKPRYFDSVDEAIAAGFELKTTNPEDIVTERLLAGVDMRQRMELLLSLQQMGLAHSIKAKEYPAGEEARRSIGANGGPPLDDVSSAQLARVGWRQKINAPNGEQWIIAPDVEALWENAVNAHGLWGLKGQPRTQPVQFAVGGLFRSWMKLKNAWIPIKLALSLFHPVHIAHINMVDGFTRGLVHLRRGGNVIEALKAASGSFGATGAATGATVGGLLGGPPGALVGGWVGGILHGNLKAQRPGREAREAWKKRKEERTLEENALVQLMVDGGFSPQLSEQMANRARRDLAKHAHEFVTYLNKGRIDKAAIGVPRIALDTLRRTQELAMGWAMEKAIPNLKAAAYAKEAQLWISRNPHVLDDPIQYRAGLRAIGKQIDNRFGEMFYGGLFWNRYLKDAGIGSFVSLSWNLGFIREFGGAALEMITRLPGVHPSTETRKTIRSATSKIDYSLIYYASALGLIGMGTYLMTGKAPQDWLDWNFINTGEKNPDGTPRRLTTPFFSREIPMAQKHIEERGGGLSAIIPGLAEMYYNKMVFQPAVDIWNNRDYYGYELYDENAPPVQRAKQFADSAWWSEINPMSFSGAARAYQMGGKTDVGIPLSFFGFPPAPAYVEKSAFQNRVGAYYQKAFGGATRPYAERDIGQKKRDARTELQAALQSKDPARIAAAQKAAAEVHAKLYPSPYWVHQFAKLPTEWQLALAREAKGKDLEDLRKYLHSDSEWKRKGFRDKSAVDHALNVQR